MIKLIGGILLSFLVGVILMPFIIRLIRKLSCSQTILKYVEVHQSKQGTPTMGGVVFFVTTLIVVVCLMDYSTPLAMCFGVGLGFAIIGFMDDFIKVKLKQNLGLRPYQKIIGQVGIAVILAFYIYYFSPNKGVVYLPFTFKAIDLGFWIIPLVIVVCLATTNSVNLTDGLDGLAGGVSVVYSGIFIALISIFIGLSFNAGESEMFINMYSDIRLLLAIFMASIMAFLVFNINKASVFMGDVGSLGIGLSFNAGESEMFINMYGDIRLLLAIFMASIIAFLVFNTNKASVFMGDVGSLGIGGLFAATASVMGFELMLAIVGIMFVVSALSVILQVAYFKKTKGKRIFKMAPIHHHFQMCGYTEAKIGYIYQIITLMVGLVTILLTLFWV